MAEMEHRRWMATKYLYGWDYGKTRDTFWGSMRAWWILNCWSWQPKNLTLTRYSNQGYCSFWISPVSDLSTEVQNLFRISHSKSNDIIMYVSGINPMRIRMTHNSTADSPLQYKGKPGLHNVVRFLRGQVFKIKKEFYVFGSQWSFLQNFLCHCLIAVEPYSISLPEDTIYIPLNSVGYVSV